jgi:hypothetical protein
VFILYQAYQVYASEAARQDFFQGFQPSATLFSPAGRPAGTGFPAQELIGIGLFDAARFNRVSGYPGRSNGKRGVETGAA